MNDLFETIIASVPAPQVDQDAPFLMQVSTLAWSDYIGRIGCGRVLSGALKVGDELQRITTRHLEIGDPDAGWEFTGASSARVTHLWVTHGLENREVEEASAGDIVWLAGPDDITLGDTLASPEREAADAALPPLEIEEPTVSMFFLVNNGPFAGPRSMHPSWSRPSRSPAAPVWLSTAGSSAAC